MQRQSSPDQTKINLQVIENRGAVGRNQLRKIIQNVRNAARDSLSG
jgi:hypothetical protein